MSSQNNENQNENISALNRQSTTTDDSSTLDSLKASIQRGAEKIKESAEETFEDLKIKIETMKEGTKEGADNIKNNTDEQIDKAKVGSQTTTKKVSDWAHDTWDYITGKDAKDKEDLKTSQDPATLKADSAKKEWKDTGVNWKYNDVNVDTSSQINKDSNVNALPATGTAIGETVFGKSEANDDIGTKGHFDPNRSAAIQEPLLHGSKGQNDFDQQIRTGQLADNSPLGSGTEQPHLAQTVLDRPSEFGQPGHGQTSIDKTLGEPLSSYNAFKPDLHRSEGTMHLDEKMQGSASSSQPEFRHDLNRTTDVPHAGSSPDWDINKQSSGISNFGHSSSQSESDNFGQFSSSSQVSSGMGSAGLESSHLGSSNTGTNIGSSNTGASNLSASSTTFPAFGSTNTRSAGLGSSNLGRTDL